MDWLKKYSKNLFVTIIIFFLIISAVSGMAAYKGMMWILLRFPDKASDDVLLKSLSDLLVNLKIVAENFYVWVVPAVFATFLILGLILWLILKKSASNLFKELGDDGTRDKQKKKSKKDFIDHKIEQDRKRRLFLHSLSVLQRDGRLLDFMNEDLSQYDDEQVGAAVRSIQEDCRKTIKKYVNLQPVMNENEDEVVNIDAGFDMDAIKLVGNVIGDPPFEGVVKHRGWKAGRKEIPQLADIHDSTIIVPAEVEVQ